MTLFIVGFLVGVLTAVLAVLILYRKAENAAFRDFWMP